MAARRQLTEGDTSNLDFQLFQAGVVADLSGATVVLILKDKTGATVDTTTDTSLVDGLTGKVRYIPDAADLVSTKSPYTAHWKITIAGKDTYFPSGEAELWEVFAQ